ncbi:MAG TPA: GntR family transcriptional regulator [Solirubrobacteraceae bacterium]|nr:GntR family transcriptional regulator [Solirubrobacteraceae bacterium]
MLLRDSVYEGLKFEIITGVLPAGEQIQEAQLAEQFETSKTPVREALARLAQEGLLEVLPRVGYIVRSYTLEQAQAIFDFRAILEGAAAELAARYITEGELRQLEAMCELDYRSGQPLSYTGFFERNRRFHLLVATASRISYLVEALDRIFDQVDRLLHHRLDLRAPDAQLIDEHLAVVAALRRRDPDGAREAMLVGLNSTRDLVLNFLVQGGERQVVAGQLRES